MIYLMSYSWEKSSDRKRDVYGRVITWWTRRKLGKNAPAKIFTHSELLFSDGASYSSRSNGVGFTAIDYKKHPERWTAQALPWVDEGEAREHAKQHVGERYDWTGILLDRTFGTGIHRADQWWCSEIAAHIMGMYNELVCPTELWMAVEKRRHA